MYSDSRWLTRSATMHMHEKHRSVVATSSEPRDAIYTVTLPNSGGANRGMDPTEGTVTFGQV